MSGRQEAEKELDDLEAEYRYWLVEAIKLGREIDELEKRIDRHEAAGELDEAQAGEFREHLRRAHERQQVMEGTIQGIRRKLDELRERLRLLR